MPLPRSRELDRGRWSMLAVAVALVSACSSGPSSPSSPLGAPTLAAPQDDAVASGRPVLTVNNATGTGPRTYDFQVAESESALTGSAQVLFASATGIPEGSGGRTSYQLDRDVQPGRRYFWRARAVQSGSPGAWSSTFRFRTDAKPNAPPVIQSITAAARAEPRDEVSVAAVVQDQETDPTNLIYQWSAAGGTFTGTGATVRWIAPSITGPSAFDLTLTVIERYTVAVPGGGEEAHENRVTGSTTVHVNDSSREVTTLATTFIDDFLHSDRSPEFCVRNFSDSCPGKRDELDDIRKDRAQVVNDPSRSSMEPGTIAFYDSESSHRSVAVSQSGFADFRAVCHFASTSKSTGVFGIITGTCQLTNVYENWQWRQCASHFLGPFTTSTAGFIRIPFAPRPLQ
jgi:hypothetical protein